MNPETPPTPREKLEMRLTALLMGELPPEEAVAIRALMAADPALAASHERLCRAFELLREASALAEPPAPPAPVQLSSERREKLLAHFKTAAPASASPPAPAPIARLSRRNWTWIVPTGIAAAVIAVLGAWMLLPAFTSVRVRGGSARMSPDSSEAYANAYWSPQAGTINPTAGLVLQSTPAPMISAAGGTFSGSGYAGGTFELLRPSADAAGFTKSGSGTLVLPPAPPVINSSIAGSQQLQNEFPSDPNQPAVKLPEAAFPSFTTATTGKTIESNKSGDFRDGKKRPFLNDLSGEGDIALNGFNTYTGGTTETGGTLLKGGSGSWLYAPAPTTDVPLVVGQAVSGVPIPSDAPVSIVGAGGVTLNGSNTFGGASTFTGTVTGGVTLGTSGADTVTLSGKIVDTAQPGPAAISAGNGTLSLANTNTATSTTTPTAGTNVLNLSAGGIVSGSNQDKPSEGVSLTFGNGRNTASPSPAFGVGGKIDTPQTPSPAPAPSVPAPAKTESLAKLETEKAKARNSDALKAELKDTDTTKETPRQQPTPPTAPQPEVLTRDNAFSTFSLNVSDVSFKLAGANLEQGRMPDPSSIRSEEFVNAFDYRDPEPAPGAPLAFASERARYPFAQNRDLLRFSVKTAAAGRQPGRPLNIVLLLDKSGSMERADRVNIVREALRVLAAQLQPQDKLSIVTFARTPRLWADGVAGNKAGEMIARVAEITPEGGTNLDAALDLGYATAVRHYSVGSISRVVLFTDGAANLGDVDPAALTRKVETQRKKGVALDCFGIGWEGYNDDLLEQLTRNGDGRYGFINTPEEAAANFAAQLAGALQIAASDVKTQVEFNPRRVKAYRQIGYAKHQLNKEQFRDNSVNAAQIGAAESGNALYVVEVDPRGEGDLATVRVRFRSPGTNDYREHEWAVPFNGNAQPLEQSSPALRLAGTAAAFSEMLAASPYAAEVTSDHLLGLLNGVPTTYGADPRPKKLEWMIRQVKNLSGH